MIVSQARSRKQDLPVHHAAESLGIVTGTISWKGYQTAKYDGICAFVREIWIPG
jgi:hypothetical protein